MGLTRDEPGDAGFHVDLGPGPGKLVLTSIDAHVSDQYGHAGFWYVNAAITGHEVGRGAQQHMAKRLHLL